MLIINFVFDGSLPSLALFKRFFTSIIRASAKPLMANLEGAYAVKPNIPNCKGKIWQKCKRVKPCSCGYHWHVHWTHEKRWRSFLFQNRKVLSPIFLKRRTGKLHLFVCLFACFLHSVLGSVGRINKKPVSSSNSSFRLLWNLWNFGFIEKSDHSFIQTHTHNSNE